MPQRAGEINRYISRVRFLANERLKIRVFILCGTMEWSSSNDGFRDWSRD